MYFLIDFFNFRQIYFQKNFGFDCICSLCSLPATERVLSDNRLKKIQYFDNIIDNSAYLMLHSQQHLQQVYTLIRLLEAEKILNTRFSRTYYDAFQTIIAHGDQTRAKIFVQKIYTASLCCEREDSSTTLKIKLLIKNTKSYQLFKTSKQ